MQKSKRTPPSFSRIAAIRRIRFIIEPLGRDEVWPCSPQVVRRTLTELPCDDSYLERIRVIRFRSRKKVRDVRRRGWNASTNYLKGRIQIFSWPAGLGWWYGKRMPRDWLRYQRLFQYGAVLVRAKQGWWGGFWHREDLERYFVEYVLPHEVGHLVRDVMSWSYRRAERTANGFVSYLARQRRKRLSVRRRAAESRSAS